MTDVQRLLVKLVFSTGKSQTWLAEHSGLSLKHVNQMMLGRAEGSLSAWQRLLDAAGVRL